MEQTRRLTRDQLISVLLEYMLTARSHCLEESCNQCEALQRLWREYGHLAETLQLELVQTAAEALDTNSDQLEIKHRH